MRYSIISLTALLLPSCLCAGEISTAPVAAGKVYSLKELWAIVPKEMEDIRDEITLVELNAWLHDNVKGTSLRVRGDVSGWSRSGSGRAWLHTACKWEAHTFAVTIMGDLAATSTPEIDRLSTTEIKTLEGTIARFRIWRRGGDYGSWGAGGWGRWGGGGLWGWGGRNWAYGSSWGAGFDAYAAQPYELEIDLTECKLTP